MSKEQRWNGEATISQMYSFFNDRTNDAGPEFPFYEALKYLRTTHTWDMILCSQTCRSTSSTAPETPAVKNSSNNDLSLLNDSENVVQTSNEIESPKVSQPSSCEATTTECKRPTRMKRAIDTAKQVIALHKGADVIEKMAEASRKHAKVAEQMLDLDRRKSMIALFSTLGTDEMLRKNSWSWRKCKL